jgi:DNA ligase-1
MKNPIILIIFLFLILPRLVFAGVPEIQLANIYRDKIDVGEYFVSEKLDGVRAYFDGTNLISRQGNKINAPKWFLANFPKEVFEGELWIGRGQFEEVISTVKKDVPDNEQWQKIHFMLFDAPKHGGTFEQRLEFLKKIVEESNSPYLKVIKQSKIEDKKDLKKLLAEVVAAGGEGLMLHKIDSLYAAERNDDLLKLKTYQDEEAIVVEHLAGKGKFKGLMGAMIVKNHDGISFKIGSGFSDQQRKNPPKIGSTITYKFYGKTKDGKPRFASFLRERREI